MDDKKICPLSMSGPGDMDVVFCCREKCAWWDEAAQACAMAVLATAARKVSRNGR